MNDRYRPPSPTCFRCGKTPEQLEEYIEAAKELAMSPASYVREEEGTFNPVSNRFACTPCFIEIGMPSSPTGWKAP